MSKPFSSDSQRGGATHFHPRAELHLRKTWSVRIGTLRAVRPETHPSAEVERDRMMERSAWSLSELRENLQRFDKTDKRAGC